MITRTLVIIGEPADVEQAIAELRSNVEYDSIPVSIAEVATSGESPANSGDDSTEMASERDPERGRKRHRPSRSVRVG